MTITTVDIVCDVGLPDNTEFPASRIDFQLSGPDYDTVSNDVIPAVTVSAILDGSGTETVGLWPVDRGIRNTFYNVILQASFVVNGRTIAETFTLGRIAPPSDEASYGLADLLAQSTGGITVGSKIYATLADAVAAALEAAKNAQEWTPDYAQSLLDQLNDQVADAQAAATEAALYDGPKVDTFAGLAAVTSSMLDVGDLIRVIETGAVYQRVSTGGDLNYTGTGGVRLRVLPVNGRVTPFMFGATSDSWGGFDPVSLLALMVAACPVGGTVDMRGVIGAFVFDARCDVDKAITIIGPGMNCELRLADQSEVFHNSGASGQGAVIALRSSNLDVSNFNMDLNAENNWVLVGGVRRYLWQTPGADFRSLDPISVLNFGSEKFENIKVHHNRLVGLGRGGIIADGGVPYNPDNSGGVLPDLSTPEAYLRNVWFEDNYLSGGANTICGFIGGVVNSGARRNTFYNIGWSGCRAYHSCANIRFEDNVSIVDWDTIDPTLLGDNSTSWPAGTNKTGSVVEVGHEFRAPGTVSGIAARRNSVEYIGTPLSAAASAGIVVRESTTDVTIEDNEICPGVRASIQIETMGDVAVRRNKLPAPSQQCIMLDFDGYAHGYAGALVIEENELSDADQLIRCPEYAVESGASAAPLLIRIRKNAMARSGREAVFLLRCRDLEVAGNTLTDVYTTAASADVPWMRRADALTGRVQVNRNDFIRTGDAGLSTRIMQVDNATIGSEFVVDGINLFGFSSVNYSIPATASVSNVWVSGDVNLPNRRVAPPASPTSAGRPGDWAIEANSRGLWLYIGDGVTHSWRYVSGRGSVGRFGSVPDSGTSGRLGDWQLSGDTRTLFMYNGDNTTHSWSPIGLQDADGPATRFASISDSFNTGGKYRGRTIWDTTNNRLMRARGPLASDPWDVVDGSATVTPA